MSDDSQLHIADDEPTPETGSAPAYDPAVHRADADPFVELPVDDLVSSPAREDVAVVTQLRPEWATPPPGLKGRKLQLWVAQKFAEGRQARLTFDVELPDMTKVMRAALGPDADPFFVKVRAMTLQDMLAAGFIDGRLREDVEAFNSELVAYTMEHVRGEDEDDTQFNRRALASVIRQNGVMEFTQNQRDVVNATILACAVEPKIRASLYDANDDEMSLDQLTETDKTTIYNAIQEATGQVTEAELKSAVAAASAETDHELVGSGT